MIKSILKHLLLVLSLTFGFTGFANADCNECCKAACIGEKLALSTKKYNNCMHKCKKDCAVSEGRCSEQKAVTGE